MVSTKEGVPARCGPTDGLALGICRIGLAAWWDVAVVWETAVMPSSERCYALPNGHFFRSLFLQS